MSVAVSKSLPKYILVGGLNTLVSLVVIYCCDQIGMPVYLATFLGYTAGFVNGFIWNKFFTFQNQDPIRKNILPYVLAFIGSYALAYLVARLITNLFTIPLPGNYPFLVINVPLYIIVSFVANRSFVFNSSKQD